jgi:hypothetical protein
MKLSAAIFAAAAPINASAVQYIKLRRNIPRRKPPHPLALQQEAHDEHNAHADQPITP